MSPAEHVPDGYRVDHYNPDKIVLRCPDCETTTTRTSRMGKESSRCVNCDRLRGVTPVSLVGVSASGEGQRVLTDGGQPAEQRQADALEALTDQTRIQNALLLEIVHEQRARRRLAEDRMPLDFSSKGAATAIEDRALELAEQVDLESVALWSDEEPLTDGGDVVGPDESAEPEHECANCGAAYNGRGAAMQCCSDDARTDGAGQLKERDESDEDYRVDPEKLPASARPAYVQVRGQGPVYVADYTILNSGWIRVREWRDRVAKLPPHRVQAIRNVQTEFYGESNDRGCRVLRVADEDKREQAKTTDTAVPGTVTGDA